MRKQVEVYLKEAYGKERARPDLEDGHFSFGQFSYLISHIMIYNVCLSPCFVFPCLTICVDT